MATNLLGENFSYPYNGQAFMEEFFFQPEIEGRSPFDAFRVIPTKTQQQLHLPQRLRKSIRDGSGCGWNPAGTTNIDSKSVNPKKVKINLEQCEDEFDGTALEILANAGVDVNDLTDTEFEKIIETVAMNGMQYDVPVLAWFGDAEDTDNFYGVQDGFFRIFFDNSSQLGYAIDLDDAGFENNDGTLATDDAYKALKDIWENQPATLRSMPKAAKAFYVTPTIADNLRNTLENTATNAGLNRIQEGDDGQLMFRGIPLIEMASWETALADSANPFSAEADDSIGANAIVYTMPDNLVIAADTSDPETEVVTWYEMKEELYYTKARWKQAFQRVHDELVCMAV